MLSILLLLFSLGLLITICKSEKCIEQQRSTRTRLIMIFKFVTLTAFLALLPLISTKVYGEKMDGLWVIILACIIVWISYIYDHHNELGDTLKYFANEQNRKELPSSYTRDAEQFSKFGLSIPVLGLALAVSIAISDSSRGSTDKNG